MTAAAVAPSETFRAATREVYEAALDHALHGPRRDLAGRLVRGRFAVLGRTVDLAVDECVRDAAHDLMRRGWTPLELHRFAAKRLDPTGGAYLRDALAAAAQWNAATGWLTELGTVDARVWWSVGEPHLRQWAARHEVARPDALRIAVEVLALIAFLPRTERHLPDSYADGADTAAVDAGAIVADPRVVGRIDALLARANDTGFVEEARSCSRKAQELMVRYATVPQSPAAASLRGVLDVRRVADAVRGELFGVLARGWAVVRPPERRPREIRAITGRPRTG